MSPYNIPPEVMLNASKKKEASLWSGTDLEQLLSAAVRVLPEYSDRLDRIVQSTLNIWDKREKQQNKHTKNIAVAASRDLDPLLITAMEGLAAELEGLANPLHEWFHSLSAILEEGRLSKAWRMELRLRLTEIESKYQTALAVIGQFTPR